MFRSKKIKLNIKCSIGTIGVFFTRTRLYFRTRIKSRVVTRASQAYQPWQPFFLSATVHFLVVVTGILLVRFPRFTEKRHSPISVEFVESELRAFASKKKSKIPAHHTHTASQKHFSIKDLGILMRGLEKGKKRSEKKDFQVVGSKEGDLLSGSGFRAGDGYESGTDNHFSLYKYIY